MNNKEQISYLINEYTSIYLFCPESTANNSECVLYASVDGIFADGCGREQKKRIHRQM